MLNALEWCRRGVDCNESMMQHCRHAFAGQQRPAEHLEPNVHGLQRSGMPGEAALGASDVVLPRWERHNQLRVLAHTRGVGFAEMSEGEACACQPCPAKHQPGSSA